VSTLSSQTEQRIRRITSRQNATVKELRRGFSTNSPGEDGYCAIEGLKTIEEALRSGIRFRVVLFSETGLSKAERVLSQLRSNVEVLAVPNEVFRSVVETESPQGVAALAKLPEFSLAQMLKPQNSFFLIAAGVQDPGNLGTILRSAEAFEATGVLLAEKTVSRFNPKTVRASAGSIFRLPTVQINLREALSQLHSAGVRLLGTSSHRGVPMNQTDLRSACAVVIGAEGGGLPADAMAQMDELITIPHATHVESLNAGIAASLILYEAARQRRAGSST
jgi:RNA methyltransferase, TrmH family